MKYIYSKLHNLYGRWNIDEYSTLLCPALSTPSLSPLIFLPLSCPCCRSPFTTGLLRPQSFPLSLLYSPCLCQTALFIYMPTTSAESCVGPLCPMDRSFLCMRCCPVVLGLLCLCKLCCDVFMLPAQAWIIVITSINQSINHLF